MKTKRLRVNAGVLYYTTCLKSSVKLILCLGDLKTLSLNPLRDFHTALGEVDGTPLQYSHLENHVDGGPGRL